MERYLNGTDCPNDGLSELVGRISSIFIAEITVTLILETLHQYIYRTTNLNPPELFKGHPNINPRRSQILRPAVSI